jgi:AraC-like DNA-binding protein
MAVDLWTTGAHAPDRRFEAWRHALKETHLDWELGRSEGRDFSAWLQQRDLDGIRVVDCHCDPCHGWRGRGQRLVETEPYFGVLFEISGREVISQEGRETVLEPGDFVLWDSERDMQFRVIEPLHKLTLLVPKRRMQLLLPQAEHYAGTVVRGGRRGIAGIAGEALRRLAEDLPYIEDEEVPQAIGPLLSLLSATVGVQPQPGFVSSAHRDSFQRFCRFIDRNLDDPTLSPAVVAKMHGVSVRYLHMIFARHQSSFGRHVRKQRLSRCFLDLSQAPERRTVTEIAYRWGFNDVAHFSRSLKAEFGISPSEVRAGRA